jgi:hypothetical protein
VDVVDGTVVVDIAVLAGAVWTIIGGVEEAVVVVVKVRLVVEMVAASVVAGAAALPQPASSTTAARTRQALINRVKVFDFLTQYP